MKKMKLSKVSWLILSAGIFVVVLAGLGLTRSQQVKEQTKLDEELNVNEMRLSKLDLSQLQKQRDELQERINDETIRLEEAKVVLRESVESLDVVDKFFAIAYERGVTVMSISSTSINSDTVNGIGCATISLNASVSGDLMNIINFIISLNHGFTTGLVKSSQISMCGDEPTSNIQMIVYSYRGG